MLSPVETVERIYEAFYTGDLDGALTYCSTEVTIDQDPRLPWGGHYVGREGAAAFALKLAGTTEAVVTTETIFQAAERRLRPPERCGAHGRVEPRVCEMSPPQDLCHSVFSLLFQPRLTVKLQASADGR